MAECRFDATVESLAEIRKWLNLQLQQDFTDTEAGKLRSRIITVVTEWVTNILRHAETPASVVGVEFLRGDRRAMVRICDDSHGADPFHEMQVSDLDSISPLETGGRGMAMIFAMSDDCEYYQRGGADDENRLTLSFELR